jgi:ABC-type phosphate transport system substrate-binding protein
MPTSRRYPRLLGLAVLAVLGFAALASGGAAQPAAAAPAFRVIVHPSNLATRLERKLVSDIFLKKVSRWSDQRAVAPVDLTPSAPARRSFSEDVHRRSVAAVRSYWQQILFSGRGVPPPELDSDAAVVRYVVSHPGAIGYVSGHADVGAARVVPVR